MEVELRFQSTMVTMLEKLEEVKRAFCGDDPTTFLNIEDHLRSRLARSSLIPTEHHHAVHHDLKSSKSCA
ncbi:hypothetical protein HPB47_003612 [Ixodes persulcatus]|uniref:Uncharacterized protein n=1 Tax=Ixodes persulcatus TaxID=34615 RepID=A0AC60PJK1_IXOPE|nr:hypothetical protein HPB47_003612 [Ixodes persulcatus]